MTLLISQIESRQIEQDQLMRSFAIFLCLKTGQRIFQKRII